MKSKVIIILLMCQLVYNPTYTKVESSEDIQFPDLPADHLNRYLNTFPDLRKACEKSNECIKKISQSEKRMSLNACWGHERNCGEGSRFQTPICPGHHVGWAQSKAKQVETFYSQADFGYIRNQINELTVMCEPNFLTDSSLECTKYLRFCRGRNLLIDFRDIQNRPQLIRYHMDVLRRGQIVGHCHLNRSKLMTEMDHMGALQSWAPELRNFEEMPMQAATSGECDLIVDTPTFIMKIDATYNMYHHFCDFLNLYLSLFVNQTHTSVFSLDVQILIWETYPYDSPFADTFKAFTRHPVWTLNHVKGKRICFRNLVLPLLPRMIFGLYYNTPIISGCENSGLFRAFSEFILHRLAVPLNKLSMESKIRITFLSRRTKYRQVLNEGELLDHLDADGYLVRRVSFERGLTFLDQLAIIRNTDVLIGMHGAGLTHLLFLPNWGTLFELYNCEDPNCYKDLARLRGMNYITWENRDLVYPEDEGHHPQGGAHAKFTNYRFDPKEFARLVAKATDHVRHHNEYKLYNKQLQTEDYSGIRQPTVKEDL